MTVRDLTEQENVGTQSQKANCNLQNPYSQLKSPYLRPVVTGSICKDVAIMVEAAGGDGLVELLGRLQLGAGVFVPEAEAAV